MYRDEQFNDCNVIKDFNKFEKVSDIILANRIDDIVKRVKDKLYTRDLFCEN